MSELVSTRDPNQDITRYSDGLLEGLAKDGGLLTPLSYPQLSHQDLQSLSQQTYSELFVTIKSKFVDSGMPIAEIADIVSRAYSQEKFPAAENGNVVPVAHISGSQYIQKLFLGPTAAFKDMALQILGPEMDYILRARGERRTLLGATSGDTGSSAEAATKGLATLDTFMLSPLQGMSVFQRAQMGVLSGGNIHNISLPGCFDDCQDIVKAIKKDPEFKDLGAVNSINWGRIVSQVPYYVSGYLQTVKQAGQSIGEPVDFVVPSGNFGNMLAAHIARSMGVPIRRLIVATNENDVLHKFIETGVYTQSPAQITSSPSMDISKASNLERLLFDLMNHDPVKLGAFMLQFESEKSASLAEYGVRPDALKQMDFDSGRSSHADRRNAIRWVHNRSGIVIDPHTADAVNVARAKDKGDGVPIVSMATADPVKFEDTIQESLGFIPEREIRFKGLEEQAAGGFVELKLSAEAVKQYIRGHRQ